MKFRVINAVLPLLFVGPVALGLDLYGPDPMESGTGWGINGTADVQATFGYNYSLDGIPEAPNSQLGDAPTTGLKAEANLSSGAANYFSAYPIGQNFTGIYQLRFDAWMNFSTDDYYNFGAAGTTEFLGGGIGYDGIASDIGSGAQMIVTGDGGSGSDYRAFKNGAFLAPEDMNAGSRNGFDPYYSDFFTGTVTPPEDQEQEPGTNVAGSPGFQWVTWVVTNVNGIVSFAMEKPDLSTLEIVRMDCRDASCDYEGNIMLFYADFFSSVTASPQFTFGLFDNVSVTDVPEPTTLSLLSLVGLLVIRRR
jgi:hypothetical protein